MTDQKQSQFIEVTELIDSDYVPVFGDSSNRKISKPNFFAQSKKEISTFIYPTVAQLQAADLEANATNPVYVRVEETGYALYKITSLAADPAVNDISMSNGTTATFQIDYVNDLGTSQSIALRMFNKAYFVQNNTTITITVPTNAPTLIDARNYISRWVIPSTSTVKIVMPSGATAFNASVIVDHPYGARIGIEGAPTIATTATAIGAVTGSAGNWSVPMTFSSSTGISVNDYVIVRSVVGTGQFKILSGVCKVTAIVGNLVTVTNKAKNSAWPTLAFTSADITVIKTILNFSACDGFQIDGPLGNLDKIVMVGTRTSGTIGLIAQRGQSGSKGKAYVHCGSSFAITSFGDGGVYAQYGGTVDARYLVTCDCLVYNVLAQHGGSVDANDGISSGSDQTGFAATSSGDVSAERSISVGNGTYGYYAIQGGSILLVSAFAWSNVSEGFFSSWGGSVRGQFFSSQYNGSGGVCSGGFAVVPSSIFSNNNGAGLYVEGGGNAVATGSTLSSNLTFGVYCDGGAVNAPGMTASSNGINGYTAINNGTILMDGSGGTGNVSNFISATKGGMVRATNAATGGAICFSDTNGLIDLTGATGSPAISYNSEGKIINTSGVMVSGVTRIQKNTNYNSETSAALIVQNDTTPLKMLYMGYDNTRDYAVIQSVHSTVNFKNLAIQPNAGNTSIGLGTTAPTARLHIAAGTATAGSAPLKLTSGTNLTTPEDGAFEFNGSSLFFTVGGVRKTVTLV